MRDVFAGAVALLAVSGCARQLSTQAAPRLATLNSVSRSDDVTVKITRPTGECLERALQQVAAPNELLPEPLPTATRVRITALVDSLHPRAKQVLSRTRGIWMAQNIPDAAAVFLPCDVDTAGRTGG